MIGTPCLDGNLDVFYVDSLIKSIRECANQDIVLIPIFIANESMLPIARNDLIHYAYESEVDDLIFIDDDQNWTPEQLLRLLSHNVDLVGGTYRKKSNDEMYVVKILDNDNRLNIDENGLTKVQGLGTGFCRLSKNCIKKLYENAESYDEKRKSVFEYKIINGKWTGEDIVMCKKWIELGGNCYLDTKITIGHIGKLNFLGDFRNWIKNNNLLN